MNALLVTYDLNQPGQNYDGLIKAIQALGPNIKPLKSTWIVSTALTPAQAYERVRIAMDKSDHLVIINITNDDYFGWLPQTVWDWMAKYVTQVGAR